MISVVLQEVSKRFRVDRRKEIIALDRVNLSIGSGSYVVLVGPSGCGKTTLLRLCSGLELPDLGKVLHDEAAVKSESGTVAMVGQDAVLYPHLSVRGNLELGLRLRGTRREARWGQIAEVMTSCEIPEAWLDRMPEELSGGERRRVALARALVRGPQLLLLDEPLSALDVGARDGFRQLLVQLKLRRIATVIHATHDQGEALALGDRVVVMSGGKVLQEGSPQRVYDNPVSPDVASLVGTPPMNLLSGIVRMDKSGTKWFEVADIRSRMVLDQHQFGLEFGIVRELKDIERGTPVWLGIRPERLKIVAAETQPTVGVRGVLRVEVEDITYLFQGSHWIGLGNYRGQKIRIWIPSQSDGEPKDRSLTCECNWRDVVLFPR